MSVKRPTQYEIDQKTLQDKVPKCSNSFQKGENKDESKQQKQRNILSVKKDQVLGSQSLSSNNETKQQQKPAAGNLFSNLFTNNAVTNNAVTNNAAKTNGGGLFGNTTSLFTNNTQGSIFANNQPPTTGLFAKKPSDSDKPKTGGLFNSSGTGSSGASIFNFQSSGVPPVKNTGYSLFGSNQPAGRNDPNDDSGDSAQLQAAQNQQADPSKSTASYKYQATCKVILKIKAFKFKKQGGDLIQNVEVVITQDNASQMYYIAILLPATKKSIFSGLVLPNKSQVKHMNNKQQNVEVSAFAVVKSKLQQTILKCQFQKQQLGKQLHDTLEQIIKGTYVFKQIQATHGDNQKKQSTTNNGNQAKQQ